MGQNESKLLRDGARTLLQALNDRDQEVIDQCLKHKLAKTLIDNKVKIEEIETPRQSFTAYVKDKTCLGYASFCNDCRTV